MHLFILLLIILNMIVTLYLSKQLFFIGGISPNFFHEMGITLQIWGLLKENHFMAEELFYSSPKIFNIYLKFLLLLFLTCFCCHVWNVNCIIHYLQPQLLMRLTHMNIYISYFEALHQKYHFIISHIWLQVDNWLKIT